MRRREFIKDLAASGLTAGGLAAGGALPGLGGCATSRRAPSAASVVVIGGGYGGATAAKYLRVLSDHAIDVTLVEPQPQFVSSPLSNLVVGGLLPLSDLTVSYQALSTRHGVNLVRDRALRIDTARKTVLLAGGAMLRYDKLVLSPGIDPMVESIDGLAQAQRTGVILQAWSAGPETVALYRQLAAMRDGGVFAITIPETPYRCPPAPYERASLVADFLKRFKPRSKVLVLDANPDVVAMPELFKQAWSDLYGDRLEYRHHYRAIAVDAARLTVRFEIADDVTADVLNVLPPVRAGRLALESQLANVDSRWCAVDYVSFESAIAKDVHIIGDSIHAAPRMPKSGHMANGHAKVAAAAIVAQLLDWQPPVQPMLTNTCYSYVSATDVIHSAAVYGYIAADQTFKPIPGAGGVSPARSAAEAKYAMAWARNIWADSLT